MIEPKSNFPAQEIHIIAKMDCDYTIHENAENIAPVASNILVKESESNSDEPERLHLYRSIIQEISRKVTSSVSISEYMDLFRQIPSLRNSNNRILTFHSQFAKNIHNLVNVNFEKHVEGDHLKEKFESLDNLMKSQSTKSNTLAWRPPSGDVANNLKSYIMADRIKFRDQLKKLVEDKEDAVNKLKFEVNNHRNKVKMINDQLEIAEEKLRYACDEIDSVVCHH